MFMIFQISTSALNATIFILGPGNNGGDGLVAARHLFHFGYSPFVVYPKKGKTQLFTNLVDQCLDLDIPIMEALPDGYDHALSNTKLIIDALFGFSFEGPSREPFTSIISNLATSSIPVLSVDIPSVIILPVV
jgi:NAD(P)H-hydrate epimerase